MLWNAVIAKKWITKLQRCSWNTFSNVQFLLRLFTRLLLTNCVSRSYIFYLNRSHTKLSFFQGELVWFDPGVGHVLPGEVLEYHRAANVLSVQAVIAGKVRNQFTQFTLVKSTLLPEWAVLRARWRLGAGQARSVNYSRFKRSTG